jgi:hypothetical protein
MEHSWNLEYSLICARSGRKPERRIGEEPECLTVRSAGCDGVACCECKPMGRLRLVHDRALHDNRS